MGKHPLTYWLICTMLERAIILDEPSIFLKYLKAKQEYYEED